MSGINRAKIGKLSEQVLAHLDLVLNSNPDASMDEVLWAVAVAMGCLSDNEQADLFDRAYHSVRAEMAAGKYETDRVRVEYRAREQEEERSCIALVFAAVGMTLRLPLSDAEQLAEAIIKCVRLGEERERKCNT